VALEPYIWYDEVPRVLQGVPALGVAMVPVGPGSNGLTPADVISVEPSGMPVGKTGKPPPPSGEVAPIVGVGATIPLTCATATSQVTSKSGIAATRANLIGIPFAEQGTLEFSSEPFAS
jgi:hypothetical protein